MLQLLSRKGVLPRRLDILTALDDYDGVRDCLLTSDASTVTQAFLLACRFDHPAIAALLLDRSIELDPALGERVEKWRGRTAFIDYLTEHGQRYGDAWQSVVINQLFTAINEDNLQEFIAWLRREPDLLGESHLDLQMRIVGHAILKGRGAFITRLLEFHPALEARRPSSSNWSYGSPCSFALEYGHAHLILF